MLSLSTSFRSRDMDDPEAFVAYLEQLDIEGIELEYRLSDRFFAGMRVPLMKSPLQVTSVHNYFPFPTRFEKLKPAYLDSLLFSLDRLVRVAEKQGVTLGLENRAHYHELPGSDDFRWLLAEFSGGPVGYWHDTGHAHLAEKLTIVPPGFLLEKYAPELVGVHFHDAVGLKDHLPPGTGEIDFDTTRAYLQPETPVVIELKPGTDNNDIQKALVFMKTYLDS